MHSKPTEHEPGRGSPRRTRSVTETAEILGVSPQKVRNLVAAGTLRRLPDMRRILVPLSAIDDYLDGAA